MTKPETTHKRLYAVENLVSGVVGQQSRKTAARYKFLTEDMVNDQNFSFVPKLHQNVDI